jgi:hypothetical protein
MKHNNNKRREDREPNLHNTFDERNHYKLVEKNFWQHLFYISFHRHHQVELELCRMAWEGK